MSSINRHTAEMALRRFGGLFRFSHWPSWLLLWVSLMLLRWEVLGAIGVTIPKAWESGLGLGLHSDLVASLIPLVLAWLIWGATGLPRYVGFPVIAAAVWLATWANVLYITHFGVMLDWWVIRFHTADLVQVKGDVAQLGIAWRLIVSFAVFLVATGVFLWRERGVARRERSRAAAAARRPPAPGAWARRFLTVRGLGTARALGILFLFLALQQSPRAFHIHSIGHPVNSHVLKLWYVQNFAFRPFSGLEDDIGLAYGRKLNKQRHVNPGVLLSIYRDFHESDWLAAHEQAPPGDPSHEGLAPHMAVAPETVAANIPPGIIPKGSQLEVSPRKDGGSFFQIAQAAVREPAPATPAQAGVVSGNGNAPSVSEWPLLREVKPDPARTRAQRRELGLPEEGPIHVILLLVEGLRWYEINHPYAGPRIFPRINGLLKKHATVFTQGYTSSSSAGQTVRGSFTTYCSFLPNIRGPATYIAYSTVRVRCLPELMKENGYETLWFNSHRKNSHNKNFFEGTNGVDHFYDREFFWAQGIHERVGEWGLADIPVMKASLRKIEEWAKGDKPLYVQIVTVSTHTPVVPAPGIQFDAQFERELGADKEYRDFMSMFRYTDEAVGEFVDGLFASEMGKRTVVFLQGDHGNGAVPTPPLALNQLQYFDARFRTPIAVLTKSMPHPRRIRRVVHQVDVAPTAAALAGVSGKVTWIGRDLFNGSGEGTPFVYSYRDKVYWRTQTRGCYAGECFDLREKDPLYDKVLPRIGPQPELGRFFNAVIDAGGLAIGRNRISPIN